MHMISSAAAERGQQDIVLPPSVAIWVLRRTEHRVLTAAGPAMLQLQHGCRCDKYELSNARRGPR